MALTAAQEKLLHEFTELIHDVTKDSRYLAGSDLVKCEIAAPIFDKNHLVGELDIESYFSDPLNKSEQRFVEACAKIVGTNLGKS